MITQIFKSFTSIKRETKQIKVIIHLIIRKE